MRIQLWLMTSLYLPSKIIILYFPVYVFGNLIEKESTVLLMSVFYCIFILVLLVGRCDLCVYEPSSLYQLICLFSAMIL